MKLFSGIIAMLLLLTVNYSASGQESPVEVKEKFKVYGNCEMCKKNIDAAAKSVDGVKSARWNSASKMIIVKFDSSKTDLETIKKAIADVGYDTEEFRAKEETYNNLHHCCKYERPEPLEKN